MKCQMIFQLSIALSASIDEKNYHKVFLWPFKYFKPVLKCIKSFTKKCFNFERIKNYSEKQA